MEFVQARWFTPTNGRTIDLLVVHDMEAPETGTTAEAVARYFATTDRKSSAHFNIDNDSVVQSVREQDVAYHAPGANHNGIGLEHAGYARQSAAEWADHYSRAMLREQSAPLAARLCERYSIPVRYVDAAGLVQRLRGVTTHLQVSAAFRKSTHTDPGPSFPMADYLGWVRDYLANRIPKEEPVGVYTSSPVLCSPVTGDGSGRIAHWTWDEGGVYAWNFPTGHPGLVIPNAEAKAHMGPIRGLMADGNNGYILTAGTPGEGSKMSTYASRDFPPHWRA